MSYSGPNFYSWNTQIGKTYRDENGVNWLFIADYHFSRTTATHLSFLRNAFSNGDDWIVEVPFTWNDSFLLIDDFFDTMKARFENELNEPAEKADAANADERRLIRAKIFNYEKFMKVFSKNITKTFNKKLEKLEELVGDTPEARAKRRARKAERKKEFEKRNKTIISKANKVIAELGGVLKAAYYASFESCGKVPQEDRTQAKSALRLRYDRYNRNDDFHTPASFCFPGVDSHGENIVKTTQGIAFPAEIAKKLLERFMNGETFKEGMHIGNYVLTELNDQYAKIGCHLIPIDNIKALADYYGIKRAAC